mmetsp:Transcript_6978/g.14587  ORF Transcript_6978/g.14587 Transcript_6978/m.14587 type:complete len:91 (-) Transcript_6978:1128-1400(-)
MCIRLKERHQIDRLDRHGVSFLRLETPHKMSPPVTMTSSILPFFVVFCRMTIQRIAAHCYSRIMMNQPEIVFWGHVAAAVVPDPIWRHKP